MTDFLERRRNARHRAEAFWRAWQKAETDWDTLPAAKWVGAANRLLHQGFPGISFQTVAEQADGRPFQVALSSANKTAPMADVMLLAEAAPKLPFQLQTLLRRRPAAELAQRKAAFGGADVCGAALQAACSADDGGLVRLDVSVADGLPPDHRGQHVAVWMLLADALGQWDLNVKVGDIALHSQVPEGAVPLVRLPETFDCLWRDGMGRNGVYPDGRHDYQVYEGRGRSNLPPPVLVRNESAATLIGRADLAWCVYIRCEAYDEMSLAWTAEIEAAFGARIGLNGQGITTTIYTDLVEGEYRICGMAADPETAFAAAQDIAARYERLNARADAEFDPSWRHYRL